MCVSNLIGQQTPAGSLPMGQTSLPQPKLNARGLPSATSDAGNPANFTLQPPAPAAPAFGPGSGPMYSADTQNRQQMRNLEEPFWSLFKL